MEITKKLLKQKFEEYNKLYFNNELPMCRFTYTYMRDVFGRYMTNTTPKGKKIGHIWISKSIDLDEEMLRELLVPIGIIAMRSPIPVAQPNSSDS